MITERVNSQVACKNAGFWKRPASKGAQAGQGCAPCGSTGSKSGESVTCGCSCCFSTQWYTSQRSIHLQLMQMHERGASSRRRKIDSRGKYCVGAVRLNNSDACAPMRISRSVGILWLCSECAPRARRKKFYIGVNQLRDPIAHPSAPRAGVLT